MSRGMSRVGNGPIFVVWAAQSDSRRLPMRRTGLRPGSVSGPTGEGSLRVADRPAAIRRGWRRIGGRQRAHLPHQCPIQCNWRDGEIHNGGRRSGAAKQDCIEGQAHDAIVRTLDDDGEEIHTCRPPNELTIECGARGPRMRRVRLDWIPEQARCQSYGRDHPFLRADICRRGRSAIATTGFDRPVTTVSIPISRTCSAPAQCTKLVEMSPRWYLDTPTSSAVVIVMTNDVPNSPTHIVVQPIGTLDSD